MSSVVKVKGSPSFKKTLPSLKVLMRNSGPLVSSRMGSGMFFSARTFLMTAIFCACSSCVPCEKLMRATFMPASAIAEMTSSVSEAGPKVQTILVFFITHPHLKKFYYYSIISREKNKIFFEICAIISFASSGLRGRGVPRVRRGKSGHRRAGRLITSGEGDFKESATEIDRRLRAARVERRGKSSPTGR